MCELYVICERVNAKSRDLGCKVDLLRSLVTLGGLLDLYGFKYDSVTAPVVAVILELL
jgi:hypothetical protein